MTTCNAQLRDVLVRMLENVDEHLEVVDFIDETTERVAGGEPTGELLETLTIQWRRRS